MNHFIILFPFILTYLFIIEKNAILSGNFFCKLEYLLVSIGLGKYLLD